MRQNLTVRQTFGGEDMIHVLEEFEGQENVENNKTIEEHRKFFIFNIHMTHV